MAYVTDADGNWFWEEDSSSGVNTPSGPVAGAPETDPYAGYTTGSSENYGSTDGNVGGYTPDYIRDMFLETALYEGTGMYDMVSNYQYDTGSGAAAGRVSQLVAPSAREDESDDDSFFGKLKGGLAKAYDKDPLKFLQFGLQGLAGLYSADQARKLADRQSQAALDQIAAKAQVDKDEKNAYTASLKGAGAARASTKKRLTRTNGAAIYDENGKYIRG